MKDKSILFSGSCEAIAKQVQGKTYVLLQQDLENIEVNHHIQGYFDKKSLNYVKIIIDSASSISGATPVTPTIEDGYICLLKDI